VGKFYNVILCDDIREEIGNKKSLMGIFGGDVLVPRFPAQELLSNLGDGWDQAAALACDVISIPSANFTPRISLGRRL
jgi:hypothetical protein